MTRLTTLVVCLMVSAAAFSQQKIEKIVKELESKGVESSLVVKRNRDTKKVYMRSRKYDFISKNSNYANQLLAAFKADADEADEAYINAPGKQNTLVFYEGSSKTIYKLNVRRKSNEDPRVTLEIVTRDTSVKPNKGDLDILTIDMGNYSYIDLGESIGERLKDYDWESIGGGINDRLKGYDWESLGKKIGENMGKIGGQTGNSSKPKAGK